MANALGRTGTGTAVQRIGDALGVVLPDEILARLKIKEGDLLFLTEQGDGALLLSPLDADTSRTMGIAERVMHEYRETFEALAKWGLSAPPLVALGPLGSQQLAVMMHCTV